MTYVDDNKKQFLEQEKKLYIAFARCEKTIYSAIKRRSKKKEKKLKKIKKRC